MHSSASRATTIAALCGVLLAVNLGAQQDAASLYQGALERETSLRAELASHEPGTAGAELLRRVRGAVAGYEGIVGRFPRSGYSDNALWQGALLSADAFWHFGETPDRSRALRLLSQLQSEYPSSSLVRQIAEQTARLTASSGTGAPSTLTAIRREVLPAALRITLELEREIRFHEERLEGPPRVFVDLQNTRVVDALRDATLAFPDDVVRQIRIGRHADARTRVVLDLQDAGRYSVYSVYNPFRLVIDIERRTPLAANARPGGRGAAPPPTPATAPAPVPGGIASPPVPPAANSAGGFSLSRQLGLGVARIVLDPGHGGHDPGAEVRGLTEADLVLDVALRLEKLLAKEPGIGVVLTRRTDAYVPLEDRTAIANRENADLFLSIHANASSNASTGGIETYFLNFAPNPAAEAIAARENAGSVRTMNSLPDIVRAIATNNKIDESRDFATMVQNALYEGLRRSNRSTRNLGVKQAPFMVLIGATMPSILAEVSFLTNRQEAALLRTPAYRQQIAEALFAGVMKYQQSLKKPPGVATR
jgi:N-acetylmuramoyl-L-alanine amidase